MNKFALAAATLILGLSGCSQKNGDNNNNQSSSQNATPQSTTASFDSLRSQGYMIVSILDISDAEQKAQWPNDEVQPFYEVTLQKGGSTASCTISMNSFINLKDATLQNSNYCTKRGTP